MVKIKFPKGLYLDPYYFFFTSKILSKRSQAIFCYMLMILVFSSSTRKLSTFKNDWTMILVVYVTGLLTFSIHFGEDKTKCILFVGKNKIKSLGKLNICFNNIEIKKHQKMSYLGLLLDETLSGMDMALKTIWKINNRLKFLRRKDQYLNYKLRRLLCNALIPPHFDCACCSWYSNLNKKFKDKLQVLQNKCIRFCPRLGNRMHLGYPDFKKIGWLPVEERAF